MIVLPFTTSFGVLVTARLIQIMSLGAFCTADASLIVYLLGPDKSRPFTMAFHALIGAGFLAATFLVRPFLPGDNTKDTDMICGRNNMDNVTMTSDDTTATELQLEEGAIQTIAWPFIITGGWCMLFSFGFLLLAKLPYKVHVLI